MSRVSLFSLLPVVLTGLGTSVLTVRGQAPNGPAPGHGDYPPSVQPTRQSQVFARSTAPPAAYAPPVNPWLVPPGFFPFGRAPYWFPYVNFAGGGLTGAANAINAQGEFEKQFQQARLLNQEVQRSKLDTRRARIEQWQWERDNLPTREDTLRRDQATRLQLMLYFPTRLEVWNGTALNTIFAALQQLVPPGDACPPVPLDPRLMEQVGFSMGNANTGIGLLRNGPNLPWPSALKTEDFDAPRAEIDRLMKTAYEQLAAGNLDGMVLLQLNTDLDQLEGKVRGMVETMLPTQNIQARRFVRQLRDTVRALQRPDAAALYAANRGVPAGSVGELVQTMTARGLTFAPAVSGAEPAYDALHAAMVTFHRTLTEPTAREPFQSPGLDAAGRP
jgi:hypothetical protein